MRNYMPAPEIVEQRYDPPVLKRVSADSSPSGAADYDFDWIVVGSGFGGSVAALRLAEKGYRVAVLESGRRVADADFPASSPGILAASSGRRRSAGAASRASRCSRTS
jgi:hypothetical protein